MTFTGETIPEEEARMLLPEVGDRVSFEGATWRVASKGLAALQRLGGEIVPVREAYVVLVCEMGRAVAQPARETTVVQSRWDELIVLGQ